VDVVHVVPHRLENVPVGAKVDNGVFRQVLLVHGRRIESPRAFSDDEWETVASTFYSIELMRAMVFEHEARAALSTDVTGRLPSFTEHVGEVHKLLTGRRPYAILEG
jgi:hypothetical protein